MRRLINFSSVLLLAAFVILTWVTFPGWINSIFPIPTDEKMQGVLGTFGDSFGALNTLFSGLAFTGIIVSIFLQSKELSETRSEIKAQGAQFQLQTEALTKQVFESTFFQLLNLHNEITQSISLEPSGLYSERKPHITGRVALKDLYMTKFGENVFIYELGLNDKDCPADTNEYYLMFHEVYGSQLGHYFRNIYQILKFVDESPAINKKFYTNLLRAQLSSYELALLFFNCLSSLGVERFKPLIEKYEFFEHLPLLDYISNEEIIMYSKSAYGSTNKDLLEIYELTKPRAN